MYVVSRQKRPVVPPEVPLVAREPVATRGMSLLRPPLRVRYVVNLRRALCPTQAACLNSLRNIKHGKKKPARFRAGTAVPRGGGCFYTNRCRIACPSLVGSLLQVDQLFCAKSSRRSVELLTRDLADRVSVWTAPGEKKIRDLSIASVLGAVTSGPCAPFASLLERHYKA